MEKICGYTKTSSDLVRRGIAKKKPEILDEHVPNIRNILTDKLKSEGKNKDEIDAIVNPIVQSYIDGKDYSFSKNHAIPYSYVGYAMGYLRYHHTIEYYTAILNTTDNDDKINSALHAVINRGIEIKKPIFGKSGVGYVMNKEENTIYRGVDTINSLSESGAIFLESKQNMVYDTFVDFLIDVYDPALYAEMNNIEDHLTYDRVPLNATQLNILIDIGFFDNFEGNLKATLEAFTSGSSVQNGEKTIRVGKYAKKDSAASKTKKINNAREIIKTEHKFSYRKRLASELEYFETLYYQDKNIPAALLLISGEIKEGWDVSFEAYQPKTGRRIRVKAHADLGYKFKLGMFLRIKKMREETTKSGSKLFRITEADLL